MTISLSHKICALCAFVVGAGLATYLLSGRGNRPAPSPGRVYDKSGFGGYVDSKAKDKLNAGTATAPVTSASVVTKLYNEGKYAEAERAADALPTKFEGLEKVEKKKQIVDISKAKLIAAYSVARMKDYASAKKRFLDAQKIARLSGDDSNPALSTKSTVEAESAYEAIVCDQAMGKTAEVKLAYIKFLQDYPNSPLVRGAVLRLTKLYDGKLPKTVNDAWELSSKKANGRRIAAEKEQSLCGPECIAELVLRKSQTVGDRRSLVNRYASQLKTSEEGTTVMEMTRVLKEVGYTPKGVSLTLKGLSKQKLPVIAFVFPEHFVIVDKLEQSGIRLWDPDKGGVGVGGTRDVSNAEWRKMWDGIAIKLQ